MVAVVIPVSNTDSTVTRPIVKSVVEELMFSTEMPEIKDILYLQRGGIAPQAQMNTPDQALKLDVDNYLEVGYSEIQSDQFSYNKYQFEYPAFFKDSALGISIQPIYTKVQLEIAFTYKSKSYATLTTWLNTFNRKLLNSQAMDFHDVVYTYTLPTDAVAYIQQVHTLTENIAGYGDNLNTYLQKHFCIDGVVVRQNLDDSQRAVAISVKNTGCLGIFTTMPEVQETTREPPLSTLTFTYTLSYDRVTSILLNYQMYIHQQVIDLKFIRQYMDRRAHWNLHAGNRTFTQSVNAVTENMYGLLDYPNDGSNIGDGWTPDTSFDQAYTSLILPIQLDLTNLTYLLDLNDLSLYNYPTWLISLMKQYSQYLCTYRNWPLYIDAFEVNAVSTNIPVSIDNNFHLNTIITPNPRNRYYVRVTVLTNLLLMNFSDLQKDPANLLLLLQWIDSRNIYINDNVLNNGSGTTSGNNGYNSTITLETIGGGTYVTTPSLLAALNQINNSDYKFLTTQSVGTVNINAANVNIFKPLK